MKYFENKFDLKKGKLFYFILLFLQFSFANAVNVKEDSLINKFPLNDPRNPHCPCHKYQKLADDEFKKFLGQEIKINPDKNNSDYTNTFIGGSDLNSKINISSKKYHSKKRFRNFLDFKKKKGTKRKRVKKLRKDNTSCFHF